MTTFMQLTGQSTNVVRFAVTNFLVVFQLADFLIYSFSAGQARLVSTYLMHVS
jgi:hypothetical protein